MQLKRKTTTKPSPVRAAKKAKQILDDAREMREVMSLAARDTIQALSDGEVLSWYTGGEFRMMIAKTKGSYESSRHSPSHEHRKDNTMTTKMKATELSHIIETEPGKLEEIKVSINQAFSFTDGPCKGHWTVKGFTPASYKNRVIAAPAGVEVPENMHTLFPLDMVAVALLSEEKKAESA
jgi:hypothetical protein